MWLWKQKLICHDEANNQPPLKQVLITVYTTMAYKATWKKNQLEFQLQLQDYCETDQKDCDFTFADIFTKRKLNESKYVINQ